MAAITFQGLFARGRELERAFRQPGPDSVDRGALISEVHAWLKECVNFGRFLSDPSGDRTALQSRVDYWGSLLAREGHPLGDIDRLEDFDPKAGNPLEVPFPYPGLSAYGKDQHGIFCGRERDTETGVQHLELNKALLIVSESGGGKSSLVMAGILPKLKERHPEWLFASRITPGARPLDSLTVAFCDAIEAPSSHPLRFPAPPATRDGEVRLIVEAVVAALDGRRLVVFVDQLEELLTLCTDNAQQLAFSAILSGLPAEKCRVLATMRSDHLNQLQNSQSCRLLYTMLADKDGIKTLAPLGFNEIRAAILRPAQLERDKQLRFVPPTIVDLLAQQTANLVGGLPLLQFALWRLWESRPRNDKDQPLDLINEEQLRALPTVLDALGSSAEDQYRALPDEWKEACERLMLELTIPAENLQDPMRRRRRESELVRLLVRYQELNEESVKQLIERFLKAKLLVRTPAGADTQLEVAHESIFRNWPRFRHWVESEDTKARLQAIRVIGKEATAWADNARSADYLKHKGTPLTRALEYAKAGWLDGMSLEYVEACRKQEAKARVARKATWSVVAMLTLGLVFAGGWAFFEQMQREASRRTENAIVRMYTSIASQIEPWDALDLGYALSKEGKIKSFSAALEHAVERMSGTQMVGKNREAGINFTYSGSAVIQLGRSSNFQSPDTLNVFPIEPDGTIWRAPASIALGDVKDRTFAQVEVGPVDAKSGNTRLALLLFRRQRGAEIVGYRLPATGGQPALPLGEPFYLEDANEWSEISFNANGRLAVISTLMQGRSTSRVSVFSVSTGSGRLTRSEPKVKAPREESVRGVKGEAVVTASSFRSDDVASNAAAPMLVTGRLNGTVYCGEQRLTRTASGDPTPVVLLRVAPGTGGVAVLHQSGALEIGDCSSGRLELVGLASSTSSGRPSTVSLTATKSGGMRLSYVEGRRLQCISAEKGQWKISGECFSVSLPVDEAIPVPGQGESFLAIESRRKAAVLKFSTGHDRSAQEPIRTFVAGSSSMTWLPQVSGRTYLPDWADKPLGKPKWKDRTPERALVVLEGQNIANAAISPNGQHVAWTELWNRGGTTLHSSSLDRPDDQKTEIAQGGAFGVLAVNNEGLIAVVLTSTGRLDPERQQAAPAHKLKFIGSDASFPLETGGRCVVFSPDGRTVLVVGGKGGLYQFRDAKPVSVAGASASPVEGGDPTSCAVADNGTATIGLADGQVLIQKRGEAAPHPISELVPFRRQTAAQDVSIDADGRFVAVLGAYQPNSCSRPAMGGQVVQIYDLEAEDSDVPRSNGCWPGRRILALGAPRWRDPTSVVLPLYEYSRGVSGLSVASPDDYACAACSPMSEQLWQDLRRIDPQPIKPHRVRKLYGIEQ